MSRQLVVVGGGPVGLVAALHARAADLDVAVLEPREGVIDKACGEGLMPGALAELAALGVDPVGSPIAGIAYSDHRGRRAEHRFAGRGGRGVRRTELHESLAAAVADAGVPVLHRRAVALEQDAVGAELTLDDGSTLAADWVLACDGLHSSVRRMLEEGSSAARRRPSPGRGPSPEGASTPGVRAREASAAARADRRRFGVRRHVRVAPWSDCVEVVWTPSAELYVTPVAPDVVGVAVLGGRGLDLDAALRVAPALAARLAGAPLASSLRGAGPLAQRAARVRSGRVLLAGDASGYVDALTGEGLRVGFAQAREAVAALATGRPATYGRRHRAVTRGSRLITEALLAVARTPARRAIVPVSAHAPAVFGGVVERLAR